jgi:cytochrome c-type biogenesis protein CcmH/NrfG
MPNHTSIDQKALASLSAEQEAATRRIGLLHRVRSVLLAVAVVLLAVVAWAALQAPPAPAPQPTVTTAAACPPHPPATGPAGGYDPTPAGAYDPEDC